MIKKVFYGVIAILIVGVGLTYYALFANESKKVDNTNNKYVTTCMAYFVGANAEMDCVGDYQGKATMVELYHKGWTYKGDISGTNKFLLIFEK